MNDTAATSAGSGGCREAEVWWFTRRGKEKKSGGSDYRVQSLHCAITITGGWQPARCWWCARQLSDFPAFRLLGIVAGGGGCACVGTAKP